MRKIISAVVVCSFILINLTHPSQAQTYRETYTFSEDISPLEIKRIDKKFDNYYRRRVAVCVGINEYTEVPKLGAAVNDAKAMSGLFKGYGFDEVYLLTDERATKRKIINELLRFKGEAHENDLFVLYFAGHGETLVNAKGEDEGFLIAVDTKKDNVIETGISMGLFKDIGETMPNKHMLFLADCCYAGYGLTQGNIILDETTASKENALYLRNHSTRGISVHTSQIISSLDEKEKQGILVREYIPPKEVDKYLNQSITKRAVQILTAGGKSEVAHETDAHGLFTSKLISALSGETGHFKDGLISASELAHFVRQSVSKETEKKQNPIFGFLAGSGDIVFVTGQQEREQLKDKKKLSLDEIDALRANAKSLIAQGEYLRADQTITQAYTHLKQYDKVSKAFTIKMLKGLSEGALAMAKNSLSIYYAQELIALSGDLHDGFPYNNLGSAYVNISDYDRAAAYYHKALKINLELLEPGHPYIATCYNNLGSVFEKKGDYDQAITYYEKSLAMLGADHARLSAVYNNLGSVFEKKGDYNKAIEYLKKAIKIGLVMLGPDHPDLAACYNNLGAAYDTKGNYTRAIFYYTKALKIYLAVLGPDHPSLVSTYNNLGAACERNGEYTRAIGYYKKALKVGIDKLGSDHLTVLICNNNLGMAYNGLGEYDRAIGYFKKSLNIGLTKLGPDHQNVALWFNNLGMAYAYKKDFDRAIVNYEKAMKIHLVNWGPDHANVATTYANLGAAYDHKGNPSRAIGYLEKALKIYSATLGRNHPDVAILYNNLGFAYRRKIDHARAREYFEKAYKISRDQLGESHPHTKIFKGNLDSVKPQSR